MALNMLQKGVAWMASQAKTAAGYNITYTRGTDSVTLRAWHGSTEHEREDQHGFIITAEVRDFMLQASDLVLSGSQIRPIVGDLITEVVGDETRTYEVFNLDGSTAAFKLDEQDTVMRIHTRQIDCGCEIEVAFAVSQFPSSSVSFEFDEPVDVTAALSEPAIEVSEDGITWLSCTGVTRDSSTTASLDFAGMTADVSVWRIKALPSTIKGIGKPIKVPQNGSVVS